MREKLGRVCTADILYEAFSHKKANAVFFLVKAAVKETHARPESY